MPEFGRQDGSRAGIRRQFGRNAKARSENTGKNGNKGRKRDAGRIGDAGRYGNFENAGRVRSGANENRDRRRESRDCTASGTALASHLVRLKNDVLVPSRLRVNTGDTVVWRNYQASRAFTLTGSKHLFEDERLAYGNILEYAFKESGSYTFSVKGYPKMEMTITVK
ncbi:hypothetical protein RG963_11270 [Methanosarcina sp. Z-7115]|uniref:Uncharacterized protein n=1 Tax=Methanosarcina baikalica TaxID=3073890 RepID=A0ABU2D2Y2_9EURY|nr:hypothetical protein [Methanosarcina sp. Z-7115]MDR7666350.1 hypothetical protein [Methanosarcina sp. Z-7115]